MSSTVVINIGWARAGSTAFRQNFLRRHPDILAVGRSHPPTEGPSAALLHHVKTDDHAEFTRCRHDLRSDWEAFAAVNDRQVICLTDEELSIGRIGPAPKPATIAARCGELFPRARTLAIVRNQVDAIRSFHTLAQRNAHGGGLLPYSEWVRRFFLKPAEGENFAYLFAYMPTLRAFLSWQPKSDVIVLPYDLLRHDHMGAYTSLAGRLGISQQACRLLPNDIVNASPPTTAPAHDQFAIRERCFPNKEAKLEDEIEALYRQDNEELAQEFGINILPRDMPEKRATDEGLNS